MVNFCIYALFKENYYDATTAFISHMIATIITGLFHTRILKYDREVLKEKEDD